MLLISNTISDVRQALNIYRTKDIVEKFFNKLKNSLDFKRLRVNNDERMKKQNIYMFYMCYNYKYFTSKDEFCKPI